MPFVLRFRISKDIVLQPLSGPLDIHYVFSKTCLVDFLSSSSRTVGSHCTITLGDGKLGAEIGYF